MNIVSTHGEKLPCKLCKKYFPKNFDYFSHLSEKIKQKTSVCRECESKRLQHRLDAKREERNFEIFKINKAKNNFVRRCQYCYNVFLLHNGFHFRKNGNGCIQFSSQCKDCRANKLKTPEARARRNSVSRENRQKLRVENPLEFERRKQRHKELDKQYKERNKEKYAQRTALYKANNPEKVRAKDKAYKEKNKERIKQVQAAYREKNKQKYADHRKRYQSLNKDALFVYNKKWREQNKEYCAIKYKEYSKNNKEKIRLIKHRRRFLEVSQDDGSISKEYLEKLFKSATSCPYCECSYDSSSETKKKTIDHLNPLCLGGINTISNISICCKSCNSAKGKKPFTEWIETLDEPFKANAINLYKKTTKTMPEQQFLPLKFM